ncbi:MAG: hypothetical protein KDC42_04715 [Ignavibacteriae bacterium]|nr:hypothetical protein [Ignavibacteriota bacterium]
MKRFLDFTASPYFNSNKSVVRLAAQLKKYHPDFQEHLIKKEKLYDKIFSGEKYNDQVMRNLSSQLLKLAKEFIAIDLYNNDEIRKSLDFLSEANMRRLDALFTSERKALKNILQKEKLDEALFLQLHTLEEIDVQFKLHRDRQKEVFESLASEGNYLIYYFLIRLNDIYVNMKINEDALNADIDREFVKVFFEKIDFQNLINFLEQNNIKYGSIFTLYYYRMMCILNPDDSEHYHNLYNLLLKTMSVLKNAEVSQLMGTLEFVCTYKINRGDRSFYKDLFGLYDLERKYKLGHYAPGRIITSFRFRNTVLVALRVGEVDWAYDYIKNYKKYLNKENKELADFGMAMINFERGEYEKSIEALRSIKTDYSMIKVDMKYLLVKSFYELGYDEAVISQLNSFRHLVTSHKEVTDITREKGLNFINLTNSLIKLKDDPDKERADELLDRINTLNLTGDKVWLEKKINDITNKKTAI